MEKAKITEVVAALIFKGDKFLICQRPANKARGLLWEFVGGKVEAGETMTQALVRECHEELAITIEPYDVYMDITHKYPDICIHLTVFRAEIMSDEPKLIEHAAIKWITPEEIKFYSFCPADKAVLKKLVADHNGNKKRYNRNLGEKGEKSAAKYLKKKGYKIIGRNFRTPFGEVDIIAKTNDIFVFCEVKTRLGNKFGSPSEAVDGERRRRYIRSAEYFLKTFKTEHTVRFDVIEILNGKINHIENAF